MGRGELSVVAIGVSSQEKQLAVLEFVSD